MTWESPRTIVQLSSPTHIVETRENTPSLPLERPSHEEESEIPPSHPTLWDEFATMDTGKIILAYHDIMQDPHSAESSIRFKYLQQIIARGITVEEMIATIASARNDTA